MTIGGRVVEAGGTPREGGGEDEPDRDRRAVPPPVLLDALDGVAERVAVVQDLAPPGLVGVAR